MARIRTIKPQFWLDEELGAMKRDARLLYIGLWNLCDDHGVFEYKPGKIRVQLFPYDTDLTNNSIEGLLNVLEKAGKFTKFSEKGEFFGYIATFQRHQEIKKPSKWSYTTTLPDINSTPPVTHQLPTSGEAVFPPPISKGTGGRGEGDIPNPPLREKEKEKEKLEVRRESTEGDFVLPIWIKKETWDAFLEVRKKKKAPNTTYALSLIIKKLTTFKEKGDDVEKILENSIMRGYTGVFELNGGNKNNGNGHGTLTGDSKAFHTPTRYTRPEELPT